MPSTLINGLLETMDAKIFQIVTQLVIGGALILYIKDMSNRILNYYKLRMSNFSRGVKIRIEGCEGQISHIGFNEVEIILDDDYIMLVPADRFMKSTKTISMGISRKHKGSK